MQLKLTLKTMYSTMKKYILIVMLMLGFVMLTQNAMAVDLLNAENFRVEVIAEPRYVNGPSYANDGYCVDIIAVNNSNDIIELDGLSYKIRVVPLDEGMVNWSSSIRPLGLPFYPYVVRPHSKVLLESYVVKCWIYYKEHIEEDGTVTVIEARRPANEVLIMASGGYDDGHQLAFSSSVHARYKKQLAITDMNINTYIPIEPTDVEGPDARVTSQLTSVSYTNFPKGLTSDEEDEKHGKK